MNSKNLLAVILASASIGIFPARVLAQPLCEPSAAADRAMLELARSEARVAERNLAVMGEIDKFMESRKWKDGVPIGSQMNAKEADTFGALTERAKAGNLASLIESKRTRDVRVIARLARMADQAARYGLEIPSQKSEDYVLVGTLLGAREVMSVNQNEVLKAQATGDSCTLDKALVLAAKDAVKTVENIPGLADSIDKTKALAAKYGAPLKPEKMSESDRRTYSDYVFPALTKVRSYQTLAEDLIRLRRLNEVSQLQLESRRHDQYLAPGDIKYSGKTWDEWVRIGRVSKTQNSDSRVLNVINDKIPADVVKQWDAASKAREKVAKGK